MNGMQMGSPPGGDILGSVVVGIGAVVTALAFVIAFRATFWPGEQASDHPKNLIFKDDR